MAEVAVTDDDWVAGVCCSSFVSVVRLEGLNVPITASSSVCVMSLLDEPGAVSVPKDPAAESPTPPSGRLGADCAAALVVETAPSPAPSALAICSSEDVLHEETLSTSGGQVVRAEMSSAKGVGVSCSVLSLGVGMEGNQRSDNIGRGEGTASKTRGHSAKSERQSEQELSSKTMC